MTEDELGELQDELADLRAENERLQTEAADAQARIHELTNEAGTARAAVAEGEAARDVAEGALRAAVAELRRLALEAEPELPPELVAGETVEEVLRSLESARSTVARLKDSIERAQSAAEPARVPPGAPARRGADLASLSARDKIAEGLRRALP